jgi:uncharacterized LabA/DUF88 family protein
MPKQIGVFVDVSNLYYCIGKKYKGRKLDYKQYIEYVRALGDIIIANAYGAQIKNQAESFLYCLRQVGFTPKYETPKSYSENGVITKKADYDVKITVDIIENLDKLDLIVLGSADSDFVPLIKSLIEKDKKIIIFACKISKEIVLLENVTCIEIPESFIEGRKNAT